MNSWSSFHDFLCWFHLRPASLSMVHALADKVCPHSIHLMTKNMFSPDLKNLKFWVGSTSFSEATAAHWITRDTGFLDMYWPLGVNVFFTVFFFYEIRKKLILKIRKAECLTPELLIRPDFFHDPSWNLISWNTAAALRDLPCWSLNCTGRLIFLENIWWSFQTFNIQMWNGIKLTIEFKILLSCFSWWCQAWSPAPSLLARHWERARCIFTITTAAMLCWFLTY